MLCFLLLNHNREVHSWWKTVCTLIRFQDPIQYFVLVLTNGHIVINITSKERWKWCHCKQLSVPWQARADHQAPEGKPTAATSHMQDIGISFRHVLTLKRWPPFMYSNTFQSTQAATGYLIIISYSTNLNVYIKSATFYELLRCLPAHVTHVD